MKYEELHFETWNPLYKAAHLVVLKEGALEPRVAGVALGKLALQQRLHRLCALRADARHRE